jgi:hypothetical protein
MNFEKLGGVSREIFRLPENKNSFLFKKSLAIREMILYIKTMQNENNLNEISQDVLSTIRVTLMLYIKSRWEHRRVYRSEIRERVQALRVMRNSLALYHQPFIWAK